MRHGNNACQHQHEMCSASYPPKGKPTFLLDGFFNICQQDFFVPIHLELDGMENVVNISCMYVHTPSNH